MAATAY